jgi:hypothetical protein
MIHDDESTYGRENLEVKYTNYFMVGHNAFEFVLDFGQSTPEDQGPCFHTRIITSPSCAKALYDLFSQALGLYEQTFGEIQEGRKPWASGEY